MPLEPVEPAQQQPAQQQQPPRRTGNNKGQDSCVDFWILDKCAGVKRMNTQYPDRAAPCRRSHTEPPANFQDRRVIQILRDIRKKGKISDALRSSFESWLRRDGSYRQKMLREAFPDEAKKGVSDAQQGTRDAWHALANGADERTAEHQRNFALHQQELLNERAEKRKEELRRKTGD